MLVVFKGGLCGAEETLLSLMLVKETGAEASWMVVVLVKGVGSILLPVDPTFVYELGMVVVSVVSMLLNGVAATLLWIEPLPLKGDGAAVSWKYELTSLNGVGCKAEVEVELFSALWNWVGCTADVLV